GSAGRSTADFLFTRVTAQVMFSGGTLAGCQVRPSFDSNRWKRAPCFLIFVRVLSLNCVTGTIDSSEVTSVGPPPGISGLTKKSLSAPSRATPIEGNIRYAVAMNLLLCLAWRLHGRRRKELARLFIERAEVIKRVLMLREGIELRRLFDRFVKD